MHCALPLSIVQNGIPSYFLPCPDATPTAQETSTIPHPKKHGRYNLSRSNPLATDYTPFHLLQKNTNDTWQHEYNAGLLRHPQFLYHFSKGCPRLHHEIESIFLRPAILHRSHSAVIR